MQTLHHRQPADMGWGLHSLLVGHDCATRGTLTWQSAGAQRKVTAAWPTAALLSKDMIVIAVQPTRTEPALQTYARQQKGIG